MSYTLPHKTLNILFQTKLQQLLPDKMDKVTDQVPGQVGAGTPAGGAEAETPGAAFGVIGTQVERAIGALVTAGTLYVTLKHKLE